MTRETEGTRMPHYLLSMHMTDDTPPERTPDQRNASMKAIDALNDDLRASGSWVFGGALHGTDTATVVAVRDGETLTTDGPYVESKEHIGGFYIIDAADGDEALRWAARTADAIGMPIEVRPFHDSQAAPSERPADGR